MTYSSDLYPGFIVARNSESLYQVVSDMAETIMTMDSITRAQYEAQEIMKLPYDQIDGRAQEDLTSFINDMCPPFLCVSADLAYMQNILIDVDEERLSEAIERGIVAMLGSHHQVLSFLDDMQQTSFRYLLWMDSDRSQYALFSLETDETNTIWTELHWEYRQPLNL